MKGNTKRALAPKVKKEDILQEYLNKKWDQTEFGKDWELQCRSGPDRRNGRYNAGEVGEIDLLAKHRNEPKWLVIELKKGSSGDKTVGQILRYIGWIKKHRATVHESVEGLIVSSSRSKKLEYALYCVPFIRLKLYRMDENDTLVFLDPLVAHIRDLPRGEKLQLFKKLIHELRLPIKLPAK